uniref:Uncharacterized protein n=1 Tax=Myotis myotis TaxID=51298 RepID=A0A7J7V432_MYOMY|nr:hypothetical protein mMyoMyo1_008485 [Myotis myotis]
MLNAGAVPWWSVRSHRGSSAQPQARLMAASTAVVVGASPTSSAVLRMSDCILGLLPAGKWTSPEGFRAARRMPDCQLGPDPPGNRHKPAGGHPLRGPRLQEGTGWTERPPPPLSAQIFVHQASSNYIIRMVFSTLHKLFL